MYLRFVVAEKDEDSGRRQGIFIVAYALRDSGNLLDYEAERITESLTWFKKNLKIPDKFSISVKSNAKPRAISWYKNTALECISRMYALKAILETNGIFVELIKTDNPGLIVYEDEHQVTAEPFKSTDA